MEFEGQKKRKTVREEYVVLLRAEAELLLPGETFSKMRDYYTRLSDSCMAWATEIYGERLRREFLELREIRDKARFKGAQYRFSMRVPWQDGRHVTVLCESERLVGGVSADRFCLGHTWNIEEETVLPFDQILRLWGIRLSKGELPFSPDGVFREGESLVLFKNPRGESRYLEIRRPIRLLE